MAYVFQAYFYIPFCPLNPQPDKITWQYEEMLPRIFYQDMHEPLFSKSSSDRGSFAIWAGCFKLQIGITGTMTGNLMLRNCNILDVIMVLWLCYYKKFSCGIA